MKENTLPGKHVFLFMGLALVVLGALLLISPAAVGGAVVRLVALVLMITGAVQTVQGLRAGSMVHTVVSSLLGIVIAGLGVVIWMNPQTGSGFLTALLMIFFVVNGLWKTTMAFRLRRVTGWLWLLLSGLLSLVFVYLLWAQWPLSGAWAIGVLVGLDLLLAGVSMILISVRLGKVRSTDRFDTINL